MLSVAELKRHLRITHAADDGYLADLEAAAVAVVEQRTGEHLGAVGERTEYVTGNGTARLYLSSAVIDAADEYDVAVEERANPGDDATELVLGEDYAARGKVLVRLGGGVWTRDYEYAVTYARGYDEGAAPEHYYQAVRMLVAHWYVNRTPAAQASGDILGDVLPWQPVIS